MLKPSSENTMFWQESPPQQPSLDASDVVDLVFRISGQALPTDHAYALFHALARSLPWIQQDEQLGIHHIHIAESGNGWTRPNETGLLQLSRRARLVFRLHQDKLESARSLCGEHIAVNDQLIEIGPANVRPLKPLNTLFARYVDYGDYRDETTFLRRTQERLQDLGITPTKLLCGKTRLIRTPTRTLQTRSLMIADLKPAESLLIQQFGLGEGRKLGCGLFLPHRGIEAVYDSHPA